MARELVVWSNLNHPNILPFEGFCLSESLETAWLISPYEPGGNLATYVQETEPSPDEATRLQLASFCSRPPLTQCIADYLI